MRLTLGPSPWLHRHLQRHAPGAGTHLDAGVLDRRGGVVTSDGFCGMRGGGWQMAPSPLALALIAGTCADRNRSAGRLRRAILKASHLKKWTMSRRRSVWGRAGRLPSMSDVIGQTLAWCFRTL